MVSSFAKQFLLRLPSQLPHEGSDARTVLFFYFSERKDKDLRGVSPVSIIATAQLLLWYIPAVLAAASNWELNNRNNRPAACTASAHPTAANRESFRKIKGALPSSLLTIYLKIFVNEK